MAGQTQDVQMQDASTPAFFGRLPIELRDKIYELAFGTELASSRVLWRKEWRDREMKKREDLNRPSFSNPVINHRYEMRPFPGNPLQPLMVSKQFFHEAASAWFRSATLQFESNDALDKFIQELNYTPLSGITNVEVTWRCCKFQRGMFSPNLAWLTGLRKLKVTIDGGLEVLEDKLDFIDELDANDFTTLQITSNVAAVSGLTALKIHDGKHKDVQTSEERDRYRDNLRALQDYIVSRIGQMPEIGANTSSFWNPKSIQEAKKQAWSAAILNQPDNATSIVQLAMKRFTTDAKGEPTEHQLEPKASQGDCIIDMDLHTSMKDVGTALDNLRSSPSRRERSVSRGRASVSDPGSSKIMKSSLSRKQRSRSRASRDTGLSKKEWAFGGLLLLNTVCSMLALYKCTNA